MKRFVTCLSVLVLVLVLGLASAAAADSYSFSAADVKSVMQSYGAPLSDSTNLWGLWAVRTMPIVTGGSFTINGGSTTQTGWFTETPSTYGWHSPYGTNCAWFGDNSGSEAGLPANPLYMIMNQPASRFESNAFQNGVWVGTYPTFTEATGANIVTAVNDASTFTVNFDLGSGASWNGAFQFVVDGSRFTAAANPASWNADFFGGYGTGGGLASNMGNGYQVPLPGAVWLLGSGLAGLGLLRGRKFFNR